MGSQRKTAKQNLIVASVNTALERGLITLECEPVEPAIFEFVIGAYPVIAHVNDAGFDEVAVKAIACPTELAQSIIMLKSDISKYLDAHDTYNKGIRP